MALHWPRQLCFNCCASALGGVGALSVLIAGVDEAGRGPLAGPVVAAAVILDPRRPIRGLRDSKQLTPERRAVLALRIRERAIGVAVAQADHGEVDLFNILQATLLAMKWALLDLPERPCEIIIDGNCSPQLHDCLGIVRSVRWFVAMISYPVSVPLRSSPRLIVMP
jgi:hypothetical protein